MPAEPLLVDPRSLAGSGYAAQAIVVLLIVTFVLVVAAAATRRGGATPGTLLRRWLTWSILAPLWWLACFAGPGPVAVLVAAFSILGLLEFSGLVDLPASHRRLLVIGAVVAAVLSLFGPAALLAMIPLLLLVGALQPVLAPDIRAGMRNLAFGALAFGYLPLLLAHAVLIALELEGGPALLFVTGVAVAFSDIGAYAIGRTFGRRRLSPMLSPNKTLEGVAGNLLGAVVAFAILFPVLPPLPPALLVALPVIVALGAVWGDLFESALKREFGEKDAGSWLPGFGGLLDRIDSLVMVVPLVYYLFRAAGFLRP
jgi:phosphatidate cytidylyltransferase